MTYNKRQRQHWNQGKAYKGTRKAKEREYTKREIKQQIAETDNSYRTPHKAKRRRDKRAQLIHRLEWHRTAVNKWKWLSNDLANMFRSTLRKLEDKWNKLYNSEESK